MTTTTTTVLGSATFQLRLTSIDVTATRTRRGVYYTVASPGGWRQTCTPEQVRKVFPETKAWADRLELLAGEEEK
ncbi:hypothetical protein ACFQ23_07590 [Schaalia naturae]|uniref:Uncharacterized protein n=1 Tax=Schaalia naturae TaxID=635203 RepID=A0ABW2SNW0_9ACTO